MIANDHIKVVSVHGYNYRVMILPVLSISHPDKRFSRRLVFDWGKSMSHPKATIAFAVLKEYGLHIQYIIYDNKTYTVDTVKICRSGRKAAYIRRINLLNMNDIVDALMAQEFPCKNIM